MVSRPEVLAIIQARGGSKGIPRKNLADVVGHPLIAYSIASARSASSISRLIVSTDDEEIAEVARQYGAEVPFIRPKNLATDGARDYPLFEHALRWLWENEGYKPDIIVQLRPTSPLRPRNLIDDAVRLLCEDSKTDSVRSVTQPSQNPYKMWKIDGNGYLTSLIESTLKEPYNMPRQELPTTYWQTGHIDTIRYETITAKHSLTGDVVKPIFVDHKYCIDIDNPRDLELLQWTIRRKELDIVDPGCGERKKRLPERIDHVVFDFDGVFTDNRVLVTEEGREAVVCNRSDGMGISLLQKNGIEATVLSTETNPVVHMRCRKLSLHCKNDLVDKASALKALADEKGINVQNVVYVGNDINDLECMKLSGFSIAVADAHVSVLTEADYTLESAGGYGAVREVCDLIINHVKRHGDQ